VLPEAGEELAQVDGVLLRVAAGDVHVVDVGENRLKVRHRPVHLPLESGAGVHEPEWHPQVLEGSERRCDCRLLDVSWVHRNLMVTFS
jgi:hypothetical protein